MLKFIATLKPIFFGFNVFKYISFRSVMACVTSFGLGLILIKLLLPWFLKLGFGERVRSEKEVNSLHKLVVSKQGVPAIGGISIVLSLILTVLFWGDLQNMSLWVCIACVLGFALIGISDDIIKLKISKPNKKRGLTAKVKFSVQIVLTFILGMMLFYIVDNKMLYFPFFKKWVLVLGPMFIPWCMLVMVTTSNAVNITDGLDGLAVGCVSIVASVFAALSYLAGHMKFATYLNIPYISGASELTVFCAALLGAMMAFLWYNSYPASVIMGDVGAMAVGGVIGLIALLIKQEFLLFFVGAIFVVETLSVIVQVVSYRLRKKRVFKMAPLHHHFQLKGIAEPKIVVRFWIIALMLAMLGFITLKLR